MSRAPETPAAAYTDEDYAKVGATVCTADDILAKADALGFVDRPSEQMIGRIKPGTWVIGMLSSFTDELMWRRWQAPA